MEKKYLYSLCLIVIFTLWSCECVPTINADKQFTPAEFANALLINAISDAGSVDIESDGLPVFKGAQYNPFNYEYIKVGSGTTNIRLISSSDKTTIFNSMFDFKLNEHYTILCYGTLNRTRALVFSDSVASANPHKAFIRFANVAGGSPSVAFRIVSAQMLTGFTSYRNFSSLFEIPSGLHSIQALSESDSVLFSLENVEIKAGHIHIALLKGDYSPSSPNKPSLAAIRAMIK